MRPERRSHLFALATITFVGLAPLVAPSVWAQQQQARPRLSGQSGSSRLDSGLSQLLTALGPRAQAAPRVGGAPRFGLAPELMQFDARGRVGVSITAANPARLVRPLTALGVQVQTVDSEHHLLEGFAPVGALPALEGLSAQGMLGVSAIPRPMVDAGSVNSQATFVLESDRVNATVPPAVTGAGVRVGIISDSYDRLGGAATGVGNGDLPAGGVTVLTEGPASGTIDEGRAMAELIHDVAPGASLAFNTGAGGPGARAQAILDLADPAKGNCKVVTDDIFYLQEPFFQDSLAAAAVDTAVGTHGAAYFCSAGNRARQAYESTSVNFTGDSGGVYSGAFYDFDPGAGVDSRMSVSVEANSSASISLQWDDPFFTPSGVDTDLNIYVLDTDTGAVVGGSGTNNLLLQTPLELFTITNNGVEPHEYELIIERFAGPTPGRIKFVYHGELTINEFATNSPTINSNAAAVNAMAVGAIPYAAQDGVEPFSSAGPSTILFAPNGTPQGAEVRSKPDLASIDGVDNSFFGFDAEGNGLRNFFGTSAAAPNAAAVAALIKEQFPSLTPAQLYARMKTYADPSVNLPGVDDQTGAGLVNAYDAVFGLSTVASMPFSEGMEGHALPLTFETHSTGAGRIQVSTANGPTSGSWHLVMDSSVAGVAGRNEVILHANLAGLAGVNLVFLQREFNDTDNAMPLNFTGSTDADGVAFSVDGVNWRRVSQLTGGNSTNTYSVNSLSLSGAAAVAGVTLSADTRIKFQQFGNQPAGSGGFAFDNITLTSTNQAPVVDANKTFTVLEDAPDTNLGITSPSDPDGDALTITVNTIPTASKGVIRRTGLPGTVSVGSTLTPAQVAGLLFDPAANANGAAGTFSYTVTDGNGGSASQVVTLEITAVNDPPVVQGDKTYTPFEDGLTFSMLISTPTDADGDTLTATVNTVPDTAKGDVRLSAGAGGAVVTVGQVLTPAQVAGLRFDPASNANGPAGTFSYTVTDGHGGSATQVITIDIIPVNDFPDAQNAKTVTVLEDSANTNLAITAPTDVDGDPLTITVTSVPNSARGVVRLAVADGGTPVSVGQTLSIPQLLGLEFDPALNATGFAGIFSYAATDPGFLSDVQLITLQITAVNDAPTVQGDKTVTVLEDSANTNLAITAPTDVEGDTLTITVTSVPSNGKGDVYLAGGVTKVMNGQTLTSTQLTGVEFDPALNANGAAGVFSYSVSDGHGGTNGQTITINITPVNDDPVAMGETYNTYRGTPLSIPAPGILGNDSDIDGDPLTAALVTGPSGGSLVLNSNGSFTYTPVIAFFGADSFTYHAYDGTAYSNTVTVTINVSENPPPADPDVQADASGTIAAPAGSGTVAISVRRANGIIMGSLTYSESDRTRCVSSTQITSLVMGPGRAMRIFGKGKLPSGTVVDFVADINDVAEPGKGKDTFKLEISNGKTPQGVLTFGNIRVNR